MFRSTKDGGASVWLSADEAAMLRSLVVPVMELLSERAGPGAEASGPAASGPAGPDPAASPGTSGATGEEDIFDDLERLFSEQEAQAPPPSTPADPVLARLLPDAYRDDPDAAGEFRKYTESSLREAKKYFAQTLLETLPPQGGRVKLTADQARDWLRALNDVRLMFGVRLEVTEDFEGQLAALAPGDPRIPALEVYGWLGAVQDSLVRALAR